MGTLKVNLEISRLAKKSNSSPPSSVTGIVTEEKEFPIFFKVDGGRFDCDKTIKISNDSSYALKLAVKPAAIVKSASLGGTSFNIEEIGRNDDSLTYKGILPSQGLQKCKTGERQQLQLTLQMEGGDEFAAADTSVCGMKFRQQDEGAIRLLGVCFADFEEEE